MPIVRLQSIANSLDHSNLSKRITMMYKQTNRVSRRLRALALAPAMLLAAVAVDSPAVASALSAASEATLAQVKTAKTAKAAPSKAAARQTTEKQVKIVGKTAAKKAAPATAGKITEKSDEPQNAVAVMPEYPGGINELMKYLAMNIHYPEAAIKANAQGRVVVKFVVKADGSVADPEIIRGQTPELDAEALRVVAAMPAWPPGKNEKGEPVSCYFTVPINFNLTGNDDKAAGNQKQTTTTTTTTTTTNGKSTTVSETRTSDNLIIMSVDEMTLTSDPASRSVNLSDAKYAPGASEAPPTSSTASPSPAQSTNSSPTRSRRSQSRKTTPPTPTARFSSSLNNPAVRN